jgi:hypothetical protein
MIPSWCHREKAQPIDDSPTDLLRMTTKVTKSQKTLQKYQAL